MCEENTIFHRKIEIQCLNTISAANLCINQLARPCLLYVSLYESDFPKSPEFSRYDFVIVMVVAVASALQQFIIWSPCNSDVPGIM